MHSWSQVHAVWSATLVSPQTGSCISMPGECQTRVWISQLMEVPSGGSCRCFCFESKGRPSRANHGYCYANNERACMKLGQPKEMEPFTSKAFSMGDWHIRVHPPSPPCSLPSTDFFPWEKDRAFEAVPRALLWLVTWRKTLSSSSHFDVRSLLQSWKPASGFVLNTEFFLWP